jgi:hypothetical protein
MESQTALLLFSLKKETTRKLTHVLAWWFLPSFISSFTRSYMLKSKAQKVEQINK